MGVVEGCDGWRRRQTLVCLWVVARVDTVIRVHGVNVDGHLFIRGLVGSAIRVMCSLAWVVVEEHTSRRAGSMASSLVSRTLEEFSAESCCLGFC